MLTTVFDFTNSNDSILVNLTNKLLSGLINGGAQLEHLKLSSLKIEDCCACTSNLFFFQDGNCKCQDDLTNFYPQIRNSHNLVFVVESADPNSLHSFNNLLNRFEPLFPSNSDVKAQELIKNVVGIFYIQKNENNYYRFFINALDDFTLLFRYNLLGTIQIQNIDVLTVFSEINISKLGIYEDIEQIGYDLAKNNILNPEVKDKIEHLTYLDRKIEDYLLKSKFNPYF